MKFFRRHLAGGAIALLSVSLGSVEAATVTLTWDPNTESDLAGYRVSYGTTSGQYFSTFDIGNTTSYFFAEPNPSVRYYLAVQAYNTAGEISPYSNEVFTTPTSPLLTVTGLSANRLSPQPVATTITFSATSIGGTTPHQYKWWIDNGTMSTVGRDWSTSNSFAWAPTVANPNYTVRVWARNASSTADTFDNPGATLEMTFVITSTVGNPATSVSAGVASIAPGGTLPAAWTGIASPSPTDWIGLYQPGAPTTAYIDWIYVSCSQTPNSPRASGSCPLVLPGNLAPGTYHLRLLANDGFTVLANSDNFTVTGGTVGGGPTLIASATLIAPGDTFTAGWTGIASPSSNDWIGLYEPNAPTTAYIDWMYVSCSNTPNSPRASGSCSFVVPGNLVLGTYHLRLMGNDGFTVLANSDNFTVTSGVSAATPP